MGSHSLSLTTTTQRQQTEENCGKLRTSMQNHRRDTARDRVGEDEWDKERSELPEEWKRR